MKLFLSTDFEGVSGIVAWEQIIEGNLEYEQGRRLLTDEVNAVISGALEAGAKEFVINDSHHYMRNLRPQELLGKAMLITGKHKPMYMMEGLDSSFDGICFVGYHGSIGAKQAVLSHTYNPGAIWQVHINGYVVGESAINALMAEMALWIRGVERVGPRTITMSSEDLLELYRMFVAVVTVTRTLVDR
jgi:D-amino peptidase